MITYIKDNANKSPVKCCVNDERNVFVNEYTLFVRTYPNQIIAHFIDGLMTSEEAKDLVKRVTKGKHITARVGIYKGGSNPVELIYKEGDME